MNAGVFMTKMAAGSEVRCHNTAILIGQFCQVLTVIDSFIGQSQQLHVIWSVVGQILSVVLFIFLDEKDDKEQYIIMVLLFFIILVV
jgi:steroid 5-alpha reductase family enzyme